MRTLVVLFLLVAGVAQAQSTSLRVYAASDEAADALFGGPGTDAPGGYAIVREQRTLDLKAGTNVLDVPRVARWLEPGAITVRTPPGVELISQVSDAETLSLDRLVERSVGAAASVETRSGAVVSGTLLSNLGGITLRLADGQVVNFGEYARVTLPNLPAGLGATPTLRWTLRAANAGSYTLDVAYPTHGLAWRAEYSAWLQPGADCRLAFGGWASVVNRSGLDFRAARVALVAGEPNLLGRENTSRTRGRTEAESGENYAVDGIVDLPHGGQAQLALFAPASVGCVRQYLYEGSRLRADPGAVPLTERGYGAVGATDVQSQLGFRPERALPAGTLRVYEDRGDAAPALLGEDRIGANPRGEALSLRLGRTADLVGERTQTDFQLDKDQRNLSESFALKLRNRGTEARRVTVREHLYRWAQWEIAQSSAKYEKRSADTIDFSVDVPPGGEAKLDYVVRYRWSASFK